MNDIFQMNHNWEPELWKKEVRWELQLSKRKTHMFPFGKTVLMLYLWVLLLAELSAICTLGIHLVSSTTVRAWGSRPTSFMVISMWQEFFKICTASSWEMLRKLHPLTSRIWSPTYKDGDREKLSMRPNETQQCLAQQRRAHAPQEPVWKSCQQIYMKRFQLRVITDKQAVPSAWFVH